MAQKPLLASSRATLALSARRQDDGQGIDDVISGVELANGERIEQLCKQHRETGSQEVEAIIEGLIRRHSRKPREPMLAHLIIDAALQELPLQMTKEVNGKEFLVGESGLAVIAQALTL